MGASEINKKSLNQLIRAVRLSEGEFSLILARSNYSCLRDQIIEQIRGSSLNILEITPHPFTDRILRYLRESTTTPAPDVAILLGMESLHYLSAAFSNMNHVREEFRRLPFPLVLWGTDDIFDLFAQHAPDFRSWASPIIRFEPTDEDLQEALYQNAEHVFDSVLNKRYRNRKGELFFFLKAFHEDSQKMDFSAGQIADLRLLQGLQAERQGEIGSAISAYREAMTFWNTTEDKLRQGVTSYLMARTMEKNGELEEATKCYEVCIDQFAQDLMLKGACTRSLCRVLRKRGDQWEKLEELARKGGETDYLALAIARNGKEPDETLLERLKTERRGVGSLSDPQLYIEILNFLHDLYSKRKEYGKAFEVKQERLTVEHDFGFRAFIGPVRVWASRQFLADKTDMAREIRASGRQRDVDALMERLSRTDCRLIVLHGPSGVGKSSLLEAGLEPALRSNRIGRRQVFSVLIRDYGDWANGLRRRLVDADDDAAVHDDHADDVAAVLAALKENADLQRLTVLIFDQFEEFFFTHTELVRRKVFFDFLHDALDAPYVKVILSLREDYLHYLLECDRLTNLVVVNNNLLDRNIRYTLGNFPPDDARDVIQSLTERGRFHPEPALVDRIVRDLAGDDGRVRPIEIQILGSQLQDRGIATLREYDALSLGEAMGPEAVLVAGFLEGAIADCGAENEDAALMALYSLIDENGARMPKSRLELANDLNIPEIEIDDEGLDLILKVLEGSGVIEKPTERYQITHDYLAERVKEKSKELIQKIEGRRRRVEIDRQRKEDEERRKKRQLRVAVVLSIVFAGVAAAAIFLGFQAKQSAFEAKQNLTAAQKSEDQAKASARKAESAALEAQKAKEEANYNLALGFEEKAEFLFEKGIKNGDPHDFQKAWLFTLSALEMDIGDRKLPASLSKLPNPDLRTGIQPWRWSSPNMASHQSSIYSVDFSPDGKTIASGSYDNTVRLWEVSTGKELAVFKINGGSAFSVAFSPNGKTIAAGLQDDTVRLLDISTGNELAVFNGHSFYVSSIAFSPDGKIIASGSHDNTVRLWEISTGNELAVLKAHTNDINSVAFGPKGKILASGSADHTVRLWEVPTGNELAVFKGHSSPVLSVDFSPEGLTIASGSDDHTMRLWEVSTGNELSVFKGHSSPVLSVDFSPEGHTIASGSGDNTLRLWEVSTREELAVLKGHSFPVLSVIFSPDGKTIASGSRDDTVRIWNVRTKRELTTFNGHSHNVSSIIFSPDSRIILTGSYDATVRLWEVSTGKEITVLKGDSSPILSLAFSPSGKIIASGSSDKTIQLWEASTGRKISNLRGHSSPVLSLAFSPCGKMLASGSSDKTVRLWDISTEKELFVINGHSSSVLSVAFSPDGKTIASGSSDKTIRLWKIPTEGQIMTFFAINEAIIKLRVKSFVSYLTSKIAFLNDYGTERISDTLLVSVFKGHLDSVNSIAFNYEGNIIASASSDETVRLWEVATGNEISVLGGHLDSIQSVAFNPDGKVIATGSDDETVRLWAAKTGNVISVFKGHSGSIQSVAFNSDGETIASGSWDKTVRFWDVPKRNKIDTFKGNPDYTFNAHFSSDGKTMASGSSDNTVRLWEVSTGEKIRTLKGHSFSFSPDGNIIATGSYDNTVRLWETSTGKALSILKGHSDAVIDVAFSMDGKIIASGSYDETVRLWRTSTGQELAVLKGHSGPVFGVSLSPDGKMVASGAHGETVRLWEVPSGKEIATLKGHSATVFDVAFNMEGTTIASGSLDSTVRLWEVSSGKELSVLKGHSSSVRGVSFSPNSKTLASCSADNTVRLWNVLSGEELAKFQGHSSSVNSVDFSPDGKTIVSASSNHEIRFWYISLLKDYLKHGRASTIFQKIHDLSFEIFPYKLEGIKMVPHTHRRIPLRSQPQPWKVFERPRPSHIDPVTWMIQNLDRMDPTEEPSD